MAISRENGTAGRHYGIFTCRQKFTLVELLVVIAMIAILAGLLLPALNNARRKAQSVFCIGNMKQLNTLSAAYYTDNDDCVVIGQMAASITKRWAYLLASYAVKYPESDTDKKKMKVPVFRCPSDTAKRYQNNAPCSYTLNDNSEGDGGNSSCLSTVEATRVAALKHLPSGQKLSKIRNTGVIVFGDSNKDPNYSDISTYDAYTVSSAFRVTLNSQHSYWLIPNSWSNGKGVLGNTDHLGGSTFGFLNGSARNLNVKLFAGNYTTYYSLNPDKSIWIAQFTW